MKKQKIWYLIGAIAIFVLLCFILLISKNNSAKKEIVVTYYYGARKENSFNISIKDNLLIKQIIKEIQKEDLPNLSNEIEFIGKYHVKIDDNTWFEFAYFDAEKIILNRNNEKIITKMDSEVIQKIASIVDKKLESDSKIFETSNITINNKKAIDISDMSWLYRIKYISKEFYWKEINLDIPTLFDATIDFHNDTIIYLYKDDKGYFVSKGYLTVKNKVYEIYNLDLLSGIITEIETMEFELS